MLGRLKFNITKLVDEILDQLPSEVWSSSTSTFLDPAIAGGQFVSAIEHRLREAGHSNKNIASRVYGYESNRMRINYAINKYKLVGTYVNRNFLKEDSVMKFDVVVGNPPYQKENNQNGKLYPSFYLKSYELLKEDGYILFVTPSAWLKRAALIFTKLRKNILENDLLYVNLDAGKYFDVGESICSFIVKKTKSNIKTKVILDSNEYSVDLNSEIKLVLTDEDKLWESINNKIISANFPKIDWREDVHDHQNKLISKGIIAKERSKTYKYPIYYTASQKQYANHLFGDKDSLRVMVNLSGHWHSYKTPWKYIRITRAMSGQGTLHLCCKDKAEARSIKSFLSSKLYHFWVQKTKTSGFNTGLAKLPMLSTNKIWTDEDLFNLFNITKEEKDFIEQHFK